MFLSQTLSRGKSLHEEQKLVPRWDTREGFTEYPMEDFRQIVQSGYHRKMCDLVGLERYLSGEEYLCF